MYYNRIQDPALSDPSLLSDGSSPIALLSAMNQTIDANLRIPNHTDPLTFEEQKDLEHQMELITQLPDPPKSRPMLQSEWENVQRLAETLRLYRETGDPQAVNGSLPVRTRINGIDYVPYVYDVLGR